MAAYDKFAESGAGGSVIDAPVDTPKPKTKLQRYNDWKKENKGAYEAARMSCCNCSPTRAEMLMIDQYENGVGNWKG